MAFVFKSVYTFLHFLCFAKAFTAEMYSNTSECSNWTTTLNFSTLNNSECIEFVQTLNQSYSTWLDKFSFANLKHSITYSILISAAYAIVFVTGIVGNFMVIAVIVLRSHMRTVSNLFILNLAVADAFILLFCLPPTLLANLITPWTLGAFMCKAVTYIQGVSVISSSYSLVAISIDRFKAISELSNSTNGFNEKQATHIIGVIWIYSLVLTLPWIFVFEVQTLEEHEYCLENWTNQSLETIYFYFITIFQNYILPVVLISLANYLIWQKVSKGGLPQSTGLPSRYSQQIQRTWEGVEKMLIIVTFTYLVSWLPLYILGTVHKIDPQFFAETVLSELLPFAQFLGYWNSCVNPVLYGFLNANFRKMFKSLFPKWLVNRCWLITRRDKRQTKVHVKTICSNTSLQGDLSLKKPNVPRISTEGDKWIQPKVTASLPRNEDGCFDPNAPGPHNLYIITTDPNTQSFTVV